MSVLGSDSYVRLDSGNKKPLGWGGKVAIIVSAAAIILFAFAVMLGNHLRSLAQPDGSGTSSQDSPGVIREFSPSPTLTAICRPFIRSSETGTAASAGETLPEGETGTAAPAKPEIKLDYNAVSLLLRDRAPEGGALRYFTSAAADRIGADRVAPDAEELSAGMRVFKVGGEYVSAVFYLSFPTEPEETRPVLREYELTLLCEIHESGADEIILFGDWTDEAGVSEVLAFARELTARTDVTLGVAVPPDFLTGEGAAARLSALSGESGGVFLALDLRSVPVPALMSAQDVLEDRLARTSELVLRYAMRVLVGCGTLPDYPAQMAAARAAGAVSVQAVGS